MKIGILTPLQKTGKKQGPPSNLRPIILLSLLRKILAIIMIKRITGRALQYIPKTQAAYQSGRSTTEHVFAIKLLAEMAITSKDLTIYLLTLDMSKAFDTVNRVKLFTILRTFLEDDELHIIKVLTEDVILRVKIGNETGEDIVTDTGVPQGDCLSAHLFILYLAQALKPTRTTTENEHNYSKARHDAITTEKEISIKEQDHSYSLPSLISNTEIKKYLNLACQYADDLIYVTTNKAEKDRQLFQLPIQLEEYNLGINQSKTEDYTISMKETENWKNCKILGSLLDTTKDIQRRKTFAINSYKKKENIYKSKKVTLKTKLRCFNAYTASIFLYNSSLWTLTKKMEKRVDTFQRNMLRKILNVKWPRIITNEELYKKTREIMWSTKIKHGRLIWYGHAQRLPNETPAKSVINYIEQDSDVTKLRGGQTRTWLKLLEKDLEEFKQHPDENINKLLWNRSAWRQRCNLILR